MGVGHITGILLLGHVGRQLYCVCGGLRVPARSLLVEQSGQNEWRVCTFTGVKMQLLLSNVLGRTVYHILIFIKFVLLAVIFGGNCGVWYDL